MSYMKSNYICRLDCVLEGGVVVVVVVVVQGGEGGVGTVL